jgi:hypothetical protein
VIVIPAMPPEQTASWHALLDLHEQLPSGWTLIGGQLVEVHCAERGQYPVRPTNDADTVVDVRADPTILRTFTKVLVELGFVSGGVSAEGLEHRWIRGDATLDVLLPEGIGEKARARLGVTGSPTLSTKGGTQALRRSETVAVTIDGREGAVNRPSLVGALVGKAAAQGNVGDRDARRHRRDFVVLARLITASDFTSDGLSKTERRRLQTMIGAINSDRELLLDIPDATEAVERVARAAGLS